MGIREKRYYGWDGELKSSGIAWLPIFFKGTKAAFKKKICQTPVCLCCHAFFCFPDCGLCIHQTGTQDAHPAGQFTER